MWVCNQRKWCTVSHHATILPLSKIGLRCTYTHANDASLQWSANIYWHKKWFVAKNCFVYLLYSWFWFTNAIASHKLNPITSRKNFNIGWHPQNLSFDLLFCTENIVPRAIWMKNENRNDKKKKQIKLPNNDAWNDGGYRVLLCVYCIAYFAARYTQSVQQNESIATIAYRRALLTRK